MTSVIGCGSLGGLGFFRGFDPLLFGTVLLSSLLLTRFVDMVNEWGGANEFEGRKVGNEP
jgi:hypothetical protein